MNKSPNPRWPRFRHRTAILVALACFGRTTMAQVGAGSPVDTFQLQLLHASDLEGASEAVHDAPRFAAIMDALASQYPHTLKLSSGDNILPSPFMFSGEDPSLVLPLKAAYERIHGGVFANNDLRAGIGRVDIAILDLLGVQASVLGNHEFDLGTTELRNIIGGVNSGSAIRWFGTGFPYLSCNLDPANDPALAALYTSGVHDHSFFASGPAQSAATIAATKKIAPSTIIEVGGERIGIVGVTTPMLASLSSVGGVAVMQPGAGTDDMAALATHVQPVVDVLRNVEGINKVILLAHLQQIHLEKQLATHLRGVDIIVAGGSNTLMADAEDRLRSGHSAAETYPYLTTDADGDPVALVNTDGEYRYVGRLVVAFDGEGHIIPSSIDAAVSGAYATDSLGVVEVLGDHGVAFGEGSVGRAVKDLCEAVGAVIATKDGDVVGRTDVYLEGRREYVRTEETNLGNLSADANLWTARHYEPAVSVSLKNGGGIRSAIGAVTGTGNIVVLGPPVANPSVGKQAGDVSRLDIENALRFNNALSLISLSAEGLVAILEHGVAATVAGATPGRFPQVAGVHFVYDPEGEAGARIKQAYIVDDAGEAVDTLVHAGGLHGDANRMFRVVTLDFLATGGDGYPFPQYGTERLLLTTEVPAGPALSTFAAAGTEQDAFAEYMLHHYRTVPFAVAETAWMDDVRIRVAQQEQPCTEQLSLVLTLDAQGSATTWRVRDALGAVVAFGGPYADGDAGTVEEAICLPAGAYAFEVLDADGDGITDGGYVLYDALGRRVVEANGSFGASSRVVSALAAPFVLPLSAARMLPGTCDKPSRSIKAPVYASVFPGATAYEYWLFDPHGTYSRKVTYTAAQFQPGNLVTLPVPLNLDLNVAVRPIVPGAEHNFSGVCRYRFVDPNATPMLVEEVLGFTIYPNPLADGQLWLAMDGVDNDMEVQVELIAMDGRMLHNERLQVPVGSSRHAMGQHLGLASGMYLVRARAADQQLTKVLVVE